MPYLEQKRKDQLDDSNKEAVTAGDLTYLLYKAAITDQPVFTSAVVDACIARYLYMLPLPEAYANYAIVLGCLQSTMLELNRRKPPGYAGKCSFLKMYTQLWYEKVVAPYEDKKIKQNGDIV